MKAIKKNTYAQDGVSVSAGDILSSYAKKMAMGTYSNNPYVTVVPPQPYFRAPIGVTINLPTSDYTTSLNSDGIGTKVGLHQAVGTYEKAPEDLIAMVCDDAVRHGNLPLLLSNILDINKTGSDSATATPEDRRNFRAIKMLYRGLVEGAKKAGVVLIGGETAELNKYTGSEIPESLALRFNMSAVVQSISCPSKMITGESVQAGQAVIALKEHGFRSNGISSVRKAFSMQFSNDWWNNPEARESILLASAPSIIYSKFISTLNGWYAKDFNAEIKLHAVAHITGGGIESKFGHDILFRKDLSASLNNLFDPPEIMKNCYLWRGMSESEAYSTWNGGQGMLIVVDNDPKVIEYVIARAKKFNIEAMHSGQIFKWRKPRLEIKSKFGNKKKTLTYLPQAE